MTSTTATTVRTDRYGFPVKDCTRCGGTGHYSYNQMTGTRCFKCGGSTVQHLNKQVAEAYAAWQEALRIVKRPTLAQVQVGDTISLDWRGDFNGPTKDAYWGTVAAIAVTPEVLGWSGPERTPVAFSMWITYTDGTVKRYQTNLGCMRRGTVDIAPYLAQATAKPVRKPRKAA